MSESKHVKHRMDPSSEWLGRLSRRGFIKVVAGMTAGAAVMQAAAAMGDEGHPLVIMEKATGMILGDPTLCVACQRCELACTEFNDGKADPALARIKIGRNMNYGPDGAQGRDNKGLFADGLVIQDTCRQCPHPVPCATACPQNAIVAQGGSGTRIVLTERCVGCRLCQKACPWGMMVFDQEKGVASKCFLCNGEPRCVEACPAQALRFVPWDDRTKQYKTRGSYMIGIPADRQAACISCHVNAPGGPRNLQVIWPQTTMPGPGGQ